MEPLYKHIHHLSFASLEQIKQEYTPVFILNTGRSGSAFIQKVFSNFNGVNSYHEAKPNLMSFPNFAFHYPEKKEVLNSIFKAGRLELILESAVSSKIYIESNQCLVFFIREILENFPNSKFIHLTRHPGDFVRSAIMKGWHKNDSIWEQGRVKLENKALWETYSHIEKLSWVWNTTHLYIENFKKEHQLNFQTFRLEDILEPGQHFMKMLEFTGVENLMRDKDLRKILSTMINKVTIDPNDPPNMFKLSSYPKYENWDVINKNSLKAFCQELAASYNYKL